MHRCSFRAICHSIRDDMHCYQKVRFIRGDHGGRVGGNVITATAWVDLFIMNLFIMMSGLCKLYRRKWWCANVRTADD